MAGTDQTSALHCCEDADNDHGTGLNLRRCALEQICRLSFSLSSESSFGIIDVTVRECCKQVTFRQLLAV